ncbi:type I-U CRISPR-associated protein Csb2 [Aromatoleum toluolicum]|uniref:Type I-U CRISPR-associated protein Cas5/Cas6 n=1 Tax=Aromatoleum toluolicum TaxID=90060 RepID=A0ABX1NAC9_9RHOO|nr:type I-U CRISPR-associated protein Csb2 [Aromatoleum toluolicum]NMF96140.1 type I-U CRISPR-associated protein Csb2 [Aromatoleum toluolicum]
MPNHWLVIEAQFLTGIYRGAEWPPAPFRLLQAIVAGNRSVTAPGLGWLERQPAPDIIAPSSPPELRYTIYVPNNSDRRKAKAATTSREVVERRVAGPVRYVFALTDEESCRDAFHVIDTASHLHTLGSGQDQVSVTGHITSVRPTCAASETHFTASLGPAARALRSNVDVILRVPIPGSLSSLETRFQASQTRLDKSKGWISPVLAPGLHDIAAYTPAGQAARVAMVPLRLQKPGNPRTFRPFDPRNTVVVAGMLRGAVMQRTAGLPLADFAAGYAPESDLERRLSWVPLPSLGHDHADGLLRRALLVAPISCLPEVANVLHCLGNEPLRLVEENSGEHVADAALADPEDGVFAAYRRPSRTWTSVTPMILPGDHAGNSRLVRNLVLKALSNSAIDAGLLEDMEVSRLPFLPQAHHVADYRLKAWQAGRLMPYHVRLHFREPMRGPVFLGRGRHFGLGVCCANPK